MKNPRVILITGASSGLGAALAIAYAAPDITLMLLARDEKRLEAVAADCRARGAQVQTALVDVRAKETLRHCITEMDELQPIDLVIANAGISAGSFDGHESQAQIDAVFEVNVGGVLNTIQPLVPRMVERGRGQIAIVSSLAGIRALPSAPAYSASKAAVRYYGDALRGLVAARGVHVSVICPGWIRTPLTDINTFPMPLIMTPERAAGIIKHNLSRKKSRIAFPRSLYFSLCLLAVLPNFLTDPLFARLPGKPHIS